MPSLWGFDFNIRILERHIQSFAKAKKTNQDLVFIPGYKTNIGCCCGQALECLLSKATQSVVQLWRPQMHTERRHERDSLMVGQRVFVASDRISTQKVYGLKLLSAWCWWNHKCQRFVESFIKWLWAMMVEKAIQSQFTCYLNNKFF